MLGSLYSIKCSSAINKQNVSISLRFSNSVLCWRGLYIYSSLTAISQHVRVLILGNYVLTACINKTDKKL